MQRGQLGVYHDLVVAVAVEVEVVAVEEAMEEVDRVVELVDGVGGPGPWPERNNNRPTSQWDLLVVSLVRGWMWWPCRAVNIN